MINELIEKLFNGDYNFVDQEPLHTKNYDKYTKETKKLEARIQDKLSEVDRRLVDELWANYAELMAERELQAYQAGIRFATQLIIAGLTKDS